MFFSLQAIKALACWVDCKFFIQIKFESEASNAKVKYMPRHPMYLNLFGFGQNQMSE